MLTAGDHGSLHHDRKTSKWSRLPYLKDLGDAAMKEGLEEPLTPYGSGSVRSCRIDTSLLRNGSRTPASSATVHALRFSILRKAGGGQATGPSSTGLNHLIVGVRFWRS
jgi:hypothetical protein